MSESLMDEAEQSEIPTARMLSWARNSTIYRLSRQMMTEKQLFDAIARKARQKFEDISDHQAMAVARSAVDFALSIGGLDDGAYADVATRSAVRNGKSKRVIAQKLTLKGIDSETAATVLQQANDLYAAVVFARKRGFGPFRRNDPDEKRKVKELSAFARNGFAFQIGKQVFDMSGAEADAILSSGP